MGPLDMEAIKPGPKEQATRSSLEPGLTQTNQTTQIGKTVDYTPKYWPSIFTKNL
jgi:hypothetical protein